MRRSNCLVGLATLVAGFAVSTASTQAQTELLSFTYSDLTGAYDTSTSLFTASDDADSDGDVTRLIPTTGDAFFGGPGVDPFGGSSAFSISMTVSGANGATASGAGTITLTDFNGDQYSGNLSGTWINVGGSANFVGVLTNILPNSVSGDGTFDGDDGSSSFGLLFPTAGPYSGNVITLAFQNWFAPGGTPQSFAGATTLASGAIVPEPATLGLLLLGGLLAGRRVRR